MSTTRSSVASAALTLALSLGLAACASMTPYQPQNNSGYGYSEQRIEKNRFRVTFSGNSDTPKQTVENYLLYRAAELTVQNGYDYFVFATEGTEADTRYLQSFDGFGSYFWYPRPAFGVSTATPITQYQAQANIVMFAGAKPADNVKAFEARQVLANLQPLIVRPQPAK